MWRHPRTRHYSLPNIFTFQIVSFFIIIKLCFSIFSYVVLYNVTLWECSLVRHYATSQKIMCLTSDKLIWIINWPNLSSCIMAIDSTHPLTEISIRNIPTVKGRPARKDDKLTAICKLPLRRYNNFLNCNILCIMYNICNVILRRPMLILFYIILIFSFLSHCLLWLHFMWLVLFPSGILWPRLDRWNLRINWIELKPIV
jgi:hypothetical protein